MVSNKSKKSVSQQSAVGELILEWLTYAFWGWFGVAIMWLGAVTIDFFVGASSDIGAAVAYPLAATIVMIIVALVTDKFYAKREPEHKTGVANIIVLVHVVLYVLVAVGSFVVALFSIISMLIESGGVDGQIVALWTSVIGVVIFGVSALRAHNGGKYPQVRVATYAVAGLLAVAGVAAGIAGPVADAQVTKQDRVIESGLGYIVEGINSYVASHDKLPSDLSEVMGTNLYSDEYVEPIIEGELVEYTSNVKQPATVNNTKTFYYRLCTTYQQASRGKVIQSAPVEDNGYSTAVPYTHGAGRECYNLETFSYK